VSRVCSGRSIEITIQRLTALNVAFAASRSTSHAGSCSPKIDRMQARTDANSKRNVSARASLGRLPMAAIQHQSKIHAPRAKIFWAFTDRTVELWYQPKVSSKKCRWRIEYPDPTVFRWNVVESSSWRVARQCAEGPGQVVEKEGTFTLSNAGDDHSSCAPHGRGSSGCVATAGAVRVPPTVDSNSKAT
jgi:hypothetical protein